MSIRTAFPLTRTRRGVALGILERPGHDADMEREREWSSEPGPKTLPWAAVTTATFSCGVEIMPIKRKLGAETLAYGGWTTWDLVSWDATSKQQASILMRWEANFRILGQGQFTHFVESHH